MKFFCQKMLALFGQCLLSYHRLDPTVWSFLILLRTRIFGAGVNLVLLSFAAGRLLH